MKYAVTSLALRPAIVHNTQPENCAVGPDQGLLVAAKNGGVSALPAWFDAENGYKPNGEPGDLDRSRDLGQREHRYARHPEKVAELRGLLANVRANGQVR